MVSPAFRVAIVGGGISGLATAYYLQKSNPTAEIRIFEAKGRAGGLLETTRESDCLMEHGPDAFLSEKPWALDLCRELGLEQEIISTRANHRRSFILVKGNLCPIPAGFYLTAPKSVSAWRQLPGMTFTGKLRMLGDLFLPARKLEADESVADFVRRRFGKETLEKLAQPMIAGIYTAEPEKLSLLATFPQFREMEKKYGSVIRGLVSQKAVAKASGPRYSLFLSLRGGMGALAERLQKKMSDQIETAAAVTKIAPSGNRWKVETADGAADFDVVCVAVPANAAAHVLGGELARKLSQIRFESVATINFLFDKKSVWHPLDGFGFVVPAAEKRSVIGCSFSHQKFEDRARSGNVLLRAFVGGAFGKEIFDLPDREMIKKVLTDLNEILDISAPPLRVLASRYPQGMPQYEVGHLERVKEMITETEKTPGLFLAGNSYRGIGIPDCIGEAQKTAAQMSRFLESRVSGLRSSV